MKTQFELNKRILHKLLIKSYNMSNLGLLSGKMGIAIFFLHYSQNTKQSVFEDYALDIIQKIYNQINQYTPLDMDSGFIGIGWGIEYLLQNKMVEAEELDICKFINIKIMETDPQRITDFSLDKGLEGLIHYVLIHYHGLTNKKTSFSFDDKYLKDLYNAVCSISQKNINIRLAAVIRSYKTFFENGIDNIKVDYKPNLYDFINEIEVNENNYYTLPLGLNYGLAGYMLNSINQ